MLILQTVWSTQRRLHWNQQEHDAQKIHSCTKFYNKWSRSFGISQSWTKVGYLSEQCGSFPRLLLLACLIHASSNPGIFLTAIFIVLCHWSVTALCLIDFFEKAIRYFSIQLNIWCQQLIKPILATLNKMHVSQCVFCQNAFWFQRGCLVLKSIEIQVLTHSSLIKAHIFCTVYDTH